MENTNKRTVKSKYPMIMRVSYFKEHSDVRNSMNRLYVIEHTVDCYAEESAIYESLNHEANILIEKIQK